VSAHASEAAARRLDDRLFIACGLAWAAGLLHATAALGRPLLVLPAAVQLAWGVALYRRPGRRLLVAGVALGLASAPLWLATRAPVEAVATLDELALALLALAELRPRRRGRVARVLRAAASTVTVYLVLLSSMALMPGTPARGVKSSLVGLPGAGLQFLCHTH
jgi:hypothetical protein